MLRSFLAALLVVAMPVYGGVAHEVVVKDLKFVHPWTKEPAGAVSVLPVYMTIRNLGTEPARILGASSPLARSARILDGKSDATADRQPVIEIPPAGSLKLTKDGPHIELIELTEPLTGYEMFPLWLTLEKQGRIEVEVMVEENEDAMTGHPEPATPPSAAPADQHAGHGDHHDHDKQEK